MAVLNVQYQAFHLASAAFTSASNKVNSAGPAANGDVGHKTLAAAGEAFGKAWDQDGPKLMEALSADAKQISDAATEFAQLDALLGEQVQGK